MADDTTRTAKLSKWGKLISKDKSDKGHFKLNEDVVDFLKPSTEKYSGDAAGTRQWSSAPRIDVAITQRWPGANDLKRVVEAEGRTSSVSDRPSDHVPATSTRRNKKNLTVSFAKTLPDIIGEGGDECDVVVTEVSRMKVARLRSFSDNRPPLSYPTQDDSSHHYGRAGQVSQHHPRPDLHRAKTSVGETSTAYQTHRKPVQLQPQPRQFQPLLPSPEKGANPSSKEPRPGHLTRAPTGFSSLSDQDDLLPPTPDTDVPAMPTYTQHQAPPSYNGEPRSASVPRTESQLQQTSNSRSRSPPLPPSANLFVRKAHNKTDAEGRNFRRVSRQVENEEDLVNLRNVSLSSVEPDSPPRVIRVSASKQESLKLAQDYQVAMDSHHTPEDDEHDLFADTSFEDTDYGTPRASRIVEVAPKIPPHLHENDRPTPDLRIETPGTDTSQAHVPQEELLTSPEKDTSRYSLSRPDALSDTLSPATVNTIASYMNFTSDETVKSRGGLQPVPPGFTPMPQGITPAQGSDSGPPQDTHASYFTLRPSQASQSAASPSLRQASSTSFPQAPSPYVSQASSPYISQAASPYVSNAPSPSIEHQQSNHRPASQASNYKAFSPNGGKVESAEQVAYNDFDARVAHMRGVFRLTAERECPIDSVSPQQWLRAAIWWLHKGRAGLGQIVRKLPRDPDGQIRELLTQAHVDVAKTWWILTEQLEHVSFSKEESPSRLNSLGREVEVIRSHLRSLALSMKKNGVMPPHQSLIQGQDTTIWIRYPRFASDAASLLRGSLSLIIGENSPETDPLEALPAGDSRSAFFYNRMFVNVSVNTDDANTDRAMLPCVLTMMRAKTDFQPTIIFSSQSDLVNVSVKPSGAAQGKGPTWQNVSWKARSNGLYVQLPRGFNLNVELGESDFRGLWNMVEFTRKIENSLQPQADERLVHRGNLAELQYSDSSNPHAFPREKVRACSALVFEKGIMQRHGTGARRLHRGFRLLLFTNPVNKTLSSVTHEVCRDAPLLFEKLGNPAANDLPVLVIRVQESKRACKALMIFDRADERKRLYDVLNGIALSQNEAFIRQSPLVFCSIEPAAALSSGSIPPGGGVLASLKWEGVRVVNKPGAGGQDVGSTVLSEDLRLVLTHESGCLTDRLNLGTFNDACRGLILN